MEQEQEQKTPSTLLKSEGTDPCGCHHAVFSDDRVETTPCIVHGLIATANALRAASNYMADTAMGIVRAQKTRSMTAAVQAGLQKGPQ